MLKDWSQFPKLKQVYRWSVMLKGAYQAHQKFIILPKTCLHVRKRVKLTYIRTRWMLADSKYLTLFLFSCVVALGWKKWIGRYCIISKFNVKVSMSLFAIVDGLKMDRFHIVSHVKFCVGLVSIERWKTNINPNLTNLLHYRLLTVSPVSSLT